MRTELYKQSMRSLFNEKLLYAPYHVSTDIEYYDDLCKKYKLLLNLVERDGVDGEVLKEIRRYTGKLREAIRRYYDGKVSTSHNIIRNLVKELITDPYAVNTIDKSNAIPGFGREIQFFRARESSQVTVFSAKEMLHIPFDKRGKTNSYRFSIPGIPCLYLGNTTYACWIELGCLPEYKFNVSPVVLDDTQRILNLAVMTRNQIHLDDEDNKDLKKNRVISWLKLIVLMIATSYVIDEKDRTFKSEYIVSQSIMLGCKELGLDGVAYFSKRVHNEAFANAAVNVALYATYQKGKNYSEICKHIKIDDSFNYSMYKQLGQDDRNKDYPDYRMNTMLFESDSIGSDKRHFSYVQTEFSSFDRFLFSEWGIKKEMIDFGNALK